MPFAIRRLEPSDAAAYREVRLEGLRTHPESFGASWAEEEVQPPAWFAARLQSCAVFGGFDADRLLGTAALAVPGTAKRRHKGILFGMYVRKEARGTGLAPALVAQVIAHATGLVEEVQLSVGTTNTAAIGLYARAGFREYGLERRALRVDGHDYDSLLMELRLA